MSYILDALKKADAERARDAAAVPDLHAQADAAVRGHRAPAWAGPWPLLGAALALIALALWAWIRFGASAPEAPPAASTAPVMLPPAPAPAVAAVAPAVSVPPPPARLPQAPLAPAVKPAPRSAAASATAPTASASMPVRTPLLAELPAELRSQLPALAVGGSVYSPDAGSRIVILNGQVFREGDKPIEGLVVERIGLKSTLLAFRGTRFELKH